MRFLVLCIALLSAAAACAPATSGCAPAAPPWVGPPEPPGSRETLVLAAAAAEMGKNARVPVRVLDRTVVPERSGGLAKFMHDQVVNPWGGLQGVPTAAILDFLARNEWPRMLAGEMPFPLASPQDRRERMNRNSGPEDILVLSLSRPGFSADGQVALVFVGLACPGLCGSAEFVILRRVAGEWRVERVHQLWVH